MQDKCRTCSNQRRSSLSNNNSSFPLSSHEIAPLIGRLILTEKNDELVVDFFFSPFLLTPPSFSEKTWRNQWIWTKSWSLSKGWKAEPGTSSSPSRRCRRWR